MTTLSTLLAGEGVPYLIDAYRIATASDGVAGRRTRELPLKDALVDFGEN